MDDGIDVYRGDFDESKVAIKHIRIFRMVMPSRRLGLEKVIFLAYSHDSDLTHLRITDVLL